MKSNELLNSFSELLPSFYISRNIGDDNVPLQVFFPRSSSKKRLLICGAVHGDEPSGSIALLEFLKQRNSREFLNRLCISFIPIVNYYGFENNKRKNEEGKDINRDFDDEKTSKQTKFLREDFSIDLARDGFLSMHEDETDFYCYTYGKNKELFNSVIETGKKFFDMQTGEIELDVNDGKVKCNIEHGQINNIKDGSFENYLFDNGLIGICPEIPTKEKLEKRIEAYRQIINSFLRYFLL